VNLPGIGDPKELVPYMAACGLIERPWPKTPAEEIPAWLKKSFVKANHRSAWPMWEINIVARRLNRSVPQI